VASDTFYDVCMYVCMHVCMRTHSAQGVGVYDVCMYVYVHISCTFVKYLWCSESGGCATDRGVSHRIVRVTCLYIYIYIHTHTHTQTNTFFCRSMYIERASKRGWHANTTLVHICTHICIHIYVHGNIIQEHAY
jgi:hypothetical protein